MPETESSVIRLARRDDAKAIAGLSRQLIEHGLKWRWQPQKIRLAMDDIDTVVIVKEISKDMAGFALASFAETTLHISLLAVKNEYQRQGIATEMLNWLIDSARVAGVGKISLEVRSGNRAALFCYQRAGFEPVGIRRGYYDGIEDATRLELKLIDDKTESRRPG